MLSTYNCRGIKKRIMLSLSYSQAMNDPTYCDTGRKGGFALMKRFGVKPNEPRPLKEIFPYTTLAEMLWCLRAVKSSLKPEADVMAWQFVNYTLLLVDMYCINEEIRDYVMSRTRRADTRQLHRPELLDRVQYQRSIATSDKQDAACWAIIAALEENSPSQIAINVSAAVIKLQSFYGKEVEEEARQRAYLESLL